MIDIFFFLEFLASCEDRQANFSELYFLKKLFSIDSAPAYCLPLGRQLPKAHTCTLPMTSMQVFDTLILYNPHSMSPSEITYVR